MDAGPPRIAAIAPNWLGDVVMALPALRALALSLSRRTPPETLDIWTPRALSPLVGALVPEAEVLPFDLGRGFLARFRARLGLAREMRAHAYRAAVMFPKGPCHVGQAFEASSGSCCFAISSHVTRRAVTGTGRPSDVQVAATVITGS